MTFVKRPLWLLISLVFLVISCNNNSYVLQYSPLSISAGAHQFCFEMKAVQKVKGQEFKTRNRLDLDIYHAVTLLNDTAVQLKCEYRSAAMEVDLGVAKMSFTSASNDTTATLQNMSPLLTALINKPMRLSINKQGEVLQTLGFADIEGSMGGVIDANKIVKGQMLDMMRKSFGDNALASMFSYFTRIFPADAVRVGDSWTINSTSHIGIELKMKGTYMLEKINGNNGVIVCQGTLESVSVDNEIAMNGVSATTNLSGTYTGSFEFDVLTGMVKNGKLEQQIIGVMQAKHANELIDMSFEADITITQQEK